MIATPAFWVMYAMFVMMAAGGLMATAQLAPIARDFKIADVPVSLLGLTLPALTFALSIDRVLNGITRPLFGWISDRIGRENTMFIAFSLEAIGILLLSRFGQDPVAFVVLSGLVFFAWGEIYSLFPATCCDTYGTRYAAANAGLLYTAKGTAALLVPLTSMLSASRRRVAHRLSGSQRLEPGRRLHGPARAQTAAGPHGPSRNDVAPPAYISSATLASMQQQARSIV